MVFPPLPIILDEIKHPQSHTSRQWMSTARRFTGANLKTNHNTLKRLKD
jgi:hypothetical protein